MRNVFITTVTAMACASTVNAADLGGSVGVEFTENSAGDYVATTTLGMGVNATGVAFGGFTVESVDGATFTIDEWQLGTTVGNATVSIGDQGDLFPSAGLEIVGGTTLADPATNDSVIVDLGVAAVMVGFTDVTTDVTDIANVQASVSTALVGADVTLAVDFNTATDDMTFGADVGYNIDSVALGLVATYAQSTETVAYEASVGYGIATAFVNGDDSDWAQNVGAGVNTEFGSLNVYAEGEYNIASEDTTFGAGVAFNF
jgi:hypothetical protein